jgi:hypothetical protein
VCSTAGTTAIAAAPSTPSRATHAARMYVIKRDGRKEKVQFDKITARINKLSYGLNLDFCDPVSRCHRSFPPPGAPRGPAGSGADICRRPRQVLVAQKVAAGVYKGVTTSELDELAAETAASLTSTHPDYALVGGVRHAVSSSPASPAPRLSPSLPHPRSSRPASPSPTCTRTRSSASARRELGSNTTPAPSPAPPQAR